MAREKNAQHQFDKTRVKITLDVEDKGAQRKEEIPFVTGIIGPFSGDKKDPALFRNREAIDIGDHNFDKKLSEVRPEADLGVVEGLGQVKLSFTSMGSFEPEAVADQVS